MASIFTKTKIGARFAVAALCVCSTAALGDTKNTFLITDDSLSPAGKPVRLSLVRTENFPSPEETIDMDQIATARVWKNGKEAALPAFRQEGKAAVTVHTPDQPGAYIYATELKPVFKERTGLEFAEYCQLEYGKAVLARRMQDKRVNVPGTEYYTTFNKTMIRVGDADSAEFFTKPIGLKFEIVPKTDPTTWRAGDEVFVRVFLDGEPIQGRVRVSASHEDYIPAYDYAKRYLTDENSTSTFVLMQPGRWFFRAHLIQPIKGTADAVGPAGKAEYESFYTGMTVHVKAR